MSLGKPLALVLEDDESAAEALSLLLRDWGAVVLQCPPAQSPLDVLGGRLPDLRWIITDYDLGGGVNGVKVARRLADDAPTARVLVLTGSVGAAADREAAAAGFELMRKPAPPDAILAWLERS